VDCRPTTYVDPLGLDAKNIIKDIIDAAGATGRIMDVERLCALAYDKAFENSGSNFELGKDNPLVSTLASLPEKKCKDLANPCIFEQMQQGLFVGTCTDCIQKAKGDLSITDCIKKWIDIYGDVIKQVLKGG